MGLTEEKTITDIVQAVKESDAKKTKGYDTPAKVTRVEDGKAWVHIPGGVPETPAELTINAQPGDSVMVRVAGGRAFLLGNATSPPTDDATAKEALSNAADALQSAVNAKLAADSAEASAATASAAAQDAVETAEAVHDIAEQAQADAETAKTNAQTAITNAAAAQAAAGAAQTSADNAQASAQSAQNSAKGALKGLSTVQDVIGVLDWAQKNATYALTTDTDIVPGKTYWTRSGSGTEADPYVYNPVVTPVKADLGTYYEISGVDEAMADFINTHLALTDDGLYVMKDGSAWKVQISDDGVYILDPTGVPANQMTGNGNIIGYAGETHALITYRQFALYKQNDGTPYVKFEYLIDSDGYITENARVAGPDQAFISYHTDTNNISSVKVNGTETPYRLSGGYGTDLRFSGISLSLTDDVVVKYRPTQTGAKDDAIAFTFGTRAGSTSGPSSFSVGRNNAVEASRGVAIGENNKVNPNFPGGVAIGYNLQTARSNQIVIGTYNDPSGDKIFIVGNGTSATSLSNAFSVDLNGNVEASGDVNAVDGVFSGDVSGTDITASGNVQATTAKLDISKYTTTGNVDKTIYDALNSLGWLSDCVERGQFIDVDLNNHGSWVDSGQTVDGKTLYQSNGSYHVGNAWDTAKITFSGYETFALDIRSYAEGNYDYVLVSQLNNDYLANCTSTSSMRSAYSNSTYTKAYTRGKQSATNYEKVTFTGLDPTAEYYFYVIFQKDGSGDSNDDRGYFYIES